MMRRFVPAFNVRWTNYDVIELQECRASKTSKKAIIRSIDLDCTIVHREMADIYPVKTNCLRCGIHRDASSSRLSENARPGR